MRQADSRILAVWTVDSRLSACQRLAKILLSRDRVKLGAAKDWLWDTEGIRASLRAEPHTRQWALRVPVECAQAARASIKLFNDEWRAAS